MQAQNLTNSPQSQTVHSALVTGDNSVSQTTLLNELGKKAQQKGYHVISFDHQGIFKQNADFNLTIESSENTINMMEIFGTTLKSNGKDLDSIESYYDTLRRVRAIVHLYNPQLSTADLNMLQYCLGGFYHHYKLAPIIKEQNGSTIDIHNQVNVLNRSANDYPTLSDFISYLKDIIKSNASSEYNQNTSQSFRKRHHVQLNMLHKVLKALVGLRDNFDRAIDGKTQMHNSVNWLNFDYSFVNHRVNIAYARIQYLNYLALAISISNTSSTPHLILMSDVDKLFKGTKFNFVIKIVKSILKLSKHSKLALQIDDLPLMTKSSFKCGKYVLSQLHHKFDMMYVFHMNTNLAKDLCKYLHQAYHRPFALVDAISQLKNHPLSVVLKHQPQPQSQPKKKRFPLFNTKSERAQPLSEATSQKTNSKSKPKLKNLNQSKPQNNHQQNSNKVRSFNMSKIKHQPMSASGFSNINQGADVNNQATSSNSQGVLKKINLQANHIRQNPQNQSQAPSQPQQNYQRPNRQPNVNNNGNQTQTNPQNNGQNVANNNVNNNQMNNNQNTVNNNQNFNQTNTANQNLNPGFGQQNVNNVQNDNSGAEAKWSDVKMNNNTNETTNNLSASNVQQILRQPYSYPEFNSGKLNSKQFWNFNNFRIISKLQPEVTTIHPNDFIITYHLIGPKSRIVQCELVKNTATNLSGWILRSVPNKTMFSNILSRMNKNPNPQSTTAFKNYVNAMAFNYQLKRGKNGRFYYNLNNVSGQTSLNHNLHEAFYRMIGFEFLYTNVACFDLLYINN